MDGQGRCRDNIFVERLWRSLKYDEVYLRADANGSEARAGIGAWFASDNTYRLQQALDYKTPDQVYAAAPAGGGHAPHRPALAA
jgi:putative transposase